MQTHVSATNRNRPDNLLGCCRIDHSHIKNRILWRAESDIRRTQILLSVNLSFPIAYLIDVLFFVKFDREFLYLTIMAAVFGVLASRIGSTGSRESELAKRRILVFGTGSKAIEVRDELRKSDTQAVIVGYFAGANENDSIIQGSRMVAQGGSLLDTAIALEADEIVIALSERRGGSMPMRELLDCRLNGIRVLDHASHFEKTRPDPPGLPLRRLAHFRRGFQSRGRSLGRETGL